MTFKQQLNDSTILSALVYLFSFIIAWFMLIYYFPFLGISLFFILTSTAVYYFKTPKFRSDAMLYSAIIILSVFFVLRDQSALETLNFFALIYLSSTLLLNKTNTFSVFQLLIAPITAFLTALYTKNTIYFDKKITVIPGKMYQLDGSRTVASIIVTLLLLMLILPLLASANPFFKTMVRQFLQIFDLFKWIKIILGETFFIFLYRVVFAAFLANFVLKLITYSRLNNTIAANKDKVGEPSDILMLPKVAVGLVIGLFIVTQLQLYFASPETLATLQYTNSRQTNEIFSQMSVVGIVVLLLLYNDKKRTIYAKVSTSVLTVEGVFLALIAFKSVFDYSFLYGFTIKRLYGFSSVFWLLGTYVLFAKKYLSHLADSTFAKQIVGLSVTTLLLINILNFDFLIYHALPSKIENGIDYKYLVSLSADADAYAALYEELNMLHNSKDKVYASYSLGYEIDYLQDKYRQFDVRFLNLSEYFQYLKIKDLDAEKLQTQYLESSNSPEQ